MRRVSLLGPQGLITILIIALGISAFSWSRESLRLRPPTLAEVEAEKRPLYLPTIRYVRLVTLGFDQFFSDILWFNTLNYFGKQFDGDKDFQWLGHMCDLVTSLDPRARHAYEFCTTLLSWVCREPEKSTQLLTRGIATEPEFWRYWYLRGFNYWYFLDKPTLAERDLKHAAGLPDAPAFLASLASRLMVKKNDITTAISFLKELIENTADETAKKALEEKLKLAYISRDIRYLRKKLDHYEQTTSIKVQDFAQLVQAGILKGIPLDPFGGKYYIEPETGSIKSESGKKGLEFFGKTAQTGLARKFH